MIETRGQEIAESYTPKRLRDPRFYTDEINRELRSAGFRPDWIDPTRTPLIDDSFTGGIFDNSLLRVVSTFNSVGGVPIQLFAKILHPGKRITSDTLDERSLEERAKYEFEHLRAWNVMGLPSPATITLFSEDVGGDGGKIRVYTILMEYIGTPAHDLDIIATNTKITDYTKRLGDPFYTPEHKERLRNAIKSLGDRRKDILKSILQTQVETELRGTYYITVGEGKGKLKTHSYSATDQLKSAVHCAKEFKRWNQVLGGIVNPSARGLDQSVGMSLGLECNEAFNGLVTFLFDNKEKKRYVQGDEFLHHYMYDFKDGKRPVSVMIDANLAQLGDPLYGVMKTLTSPLLIGISYEELSELIRFRNELLRKKTTELSRSLAGVEKLVNKEDDETSLLRADLFALFLIPKLMGLKARDENRNKPHFERLYGSVKSYAHSLVEFPANEKPEVIGFDCYDSKQSIAALRERLDEVLRHIKARHKLNGRLETTINSTEVFLGKNNYLK